MSLAGMSAIADCSMCKRTCYSDTLWGNPPICQECAGTRGWSKTCACGLMYDEPAWCALPLVGYSDADEDGDKRIEMRNCPCGSTIAILLPCNHDASK